MKRFSYLLIFGLFAACACFADTWTFGLVDANGNPLDADGTVTAPAGGTNGWGYTITNNTSDYLVIEDFNPDAMAYVTTNNLFDYPVVAPDSTYTEAYIEGTQGIYEFTWDDDVPNGQVDTGNFEIDGEYYDGDPFSGGTPDGSAGSQTATFTAEETYGIVSSTPEPGTWLLGGAGICFLFGRRRRSLCAEVTNCDSRSGSRPERTH